MKVKKYKPGMNLDGFISDMPNDVYHASAGISKSGLDKITRSPAHFFYAPQTPPTRAMVLGSATHAALLEPDTFKSQYVLLSDATDRRSSIYKEAVKAHGESFVLTASEADRVVGMQEAVFSDHVFSTLRKKIKYTELSCFYTDADGTLLKCRFDAVTSDGDIIDLKTAQDARPDAFSKSVFNYRYHVQAAYYSDLMASGTGRAPEFIFVAVESEMPHATKCYVLDDVSLDIGRQDAQKDIEVYKECVKTGVWPAYAHSDAPELLALPEWAILRHEAENDSDIIVL